MEKLESLFQSNFYIHEAFAAACMATVYKNFVSVAYVEKPQEELIAAATSISQPGESTTDAKSVAIITFNQPVVKYDNWYWLGTQTYIKILDQFKTDASIAGVVMKMDSGGGQVYGTPEFHDYIVDFVSIKPLVVYTNGYLCSGAYYIAAGASWIVANKRADAIGSIGAYTMIVDMNGIVEHFGGKVHTIYATDSTEKNKAYRDVIEKGDYKAYIKTELDPIVSVFIGDMKSTRSQIKEEAFKGGVWAGPQALEMGLVDEIGTEATAIAKVYELAESTDNKNNNNKNQKKKSMAKTKSLPRIQKTLGISGDMTIAKKTLSGKTGVFVEEAQLDALEAGLAAGEGKVKAAEDKATTAEGKVTALDTAVNAAIKTAGLEKDVEANATTEDKITLLSNKVVEYGGQPGAKGSKPKADGDTFEEEDNDDQEKSTSLIKSMGL